MDRCVCEWKPSVVLGGWQTCKVLSCHTVSLHFGAARNLYRRKNPKSDVSPTYQARLVGKYKPIRGYGMKIRSKFRMQEVMLVR